MKYGDMVGSPPENCTESCRRGLIRMALSRISLRSCQSFRPLMIASRASLTQPGQSESVWRGKPSCGLVFCQDFKSGFSDQLGVNDGRGLYLLKNWIVSNVAPATLVTAASTYFISR